MTAVVKELTATLSQGKQPKNIEVTEEREVVINFDDGSQMVVAGASCGDRGRGALILARAAEMCGFMDAEEALDAIEFFPRDYTGELFPPPGF